MKFFLSGKGNNNTPLYIALLFFMGFVSLYWIGSMIHFGVKFEYSTEKISEYFFGTKDFPEKVSWIVLSENVHVNLFISAVMLLCLAGLVLHTKFTFKTKIWIIILAFFFGLLDGISDYLVYYVGPEFSFLKLVIFILYQLILLSIIIAIITGFFSQNSNHKSGTFSFFNLIIFVFAIFNIFFVAAVIITFVSKLGYTPSQLASYYIGNENLYINPKSFEHILESAFIHFVVMGIYLIALTHFLFFTESKYKIPYTILLFGSAAIDNSSGLLIRFVSSDFTYFKLLFFWMLQLGMLGVSFTLIRYTLYAGNIQKKTLQVIAMKERLTHDN